MAMANDKPGQLVGDGWTDLDRAPAMSTKLLLDLFGRVSEPIQLSAGVLSINESWGHR